MSIHQELIYEASAKEIFTALSNAERFTAVTGARAEIQLKPGGTFSCFGGMITGFTLDLGLIKEWSRLGERGIGKRVYIPS